MVGPLISLPAGVGHHQFSPLPPIVVEANDVLLDVREGPVYLREDEGSDDLRLFEVLDGFVYQERIHHHLQ